MTKVRDWSEDPDANITVASSTELIPRLDRPIKLLQGLTAAYFNEALALHTTQGISTRFYVAQENAGELAGDSSTSNVVTTASIIYVKFHLPANTGATFRIGASTTNLDYPLRVNIGDGDSAITTEQIKAGDVAILILGEYTTNLGVRSVCWYANCVRQRISVDATLADALALSVVEQSLTAPTIGIITELNTLLTAIQVTANAAVTTAITDALARLISDNTTAIGTNTTAIASNDTDITALQTRFNALGTTTGRLLGYEEITSSDANKAIMAGATSALIEFSGGGGGGAGSYGPRGLTGGSTTIVASNGVVYTAMGGIGGRIGTDSSKPPAALFDYRGSPGGTGNEEHHAGGEFRQGDSGQPGQLKTMIFESSLFPINIRIGLGGAGAITRSPGGDGSPGFTKIKYLS